MDNINDEAFVDCHGTPLPYSQVKAAPLEEKITEIDAQLRSISSWAERTARECAAMRETFLPAREKPLKKGR